MRPTLIERADGFVGHFYDANNPGMVRICQEQSMVYVSEDLGRLDLLADDRDLIPVEKQKH